MMAMASGYTLQYFSRTEGTLGNISKHKVWIRDYYFGEVRQESPELLDQAFNEVVAGDFWEGVVLVIDGGNRVVGLAEFATHEREGRIVGAIGDIYLTPGHESNGLYIEMAETVEREAKKVGVDTLSITPGYDESRLAEIMRDGGFLVEGPRPFEKWREHPLTKEINR